jgi:hypothetical protein
MRVRSIKTWSQDEPVSQPARPKISHIDEFLRNSSHFFADYISIGSINAPADSLPETTMKSRDGRISGSAKARPEVTTALQDTINASVDILFRTGSLPAPSSGRPRHDLPITPIAITNIIQSIQAILVSLTVSQEERPTLACLQNSLMAHRTHIPQPCLAALAVGARQRGITGANEPSLHSSFTIRLRFRRREFGAEGWRIDKTNPTLPYWQLAHRLTGLFSTNEPNSTSNLHKNRFCRLEGGKCPECFHACLRRAGTAARWRRQLGAGT